MLAEALDASCPAGVPADVTSTPVATHPGSMTASAVREALGVAPPLTRASGGGGGGVAAPPAVENVTGTHPGGVGVAAWTAGAMGGSELQLQVCAGLCLAAWLQPQRLMQTSASPRHLRLMPRVRLQVEEENAEGRVREPTLEDNLGVNAMPNPGTQTGNDAPASG